MRRFRGCLLLCILLALSPLAVDFLLLHVDPLGMVRYYGDYAQLSLLALPAPDGFRYTPGYHHFSMYSATIGLDGLRIVPDSKFSDCHIVFVGDSVTFGMGANDFDVFPNLLAPILPATVTNAAFPAYSAANVERSLAVHPADGYIWFIIPNDADPFRRWERGSGELPSAVSIYSGWFFPGAAAAAPVFSGLTDPADRILARDDVLAFVSEDEWFTPLIEQHYPQVEIIPHYTGVVSRFDPHPNAAGHAQIAAAMQSAVSSFVDSQCSQNQKQP